MSKDQSVIQSWEMFDGVKIHGKLRTSRTPREASYSKKVANRRKRNKAARRSRRVK